MATGPAVHLKCDHRKARFSLAYPVGEMKCLECKQLLYIPQFIISLNRRLRRLEIAYSRSRKSKR